MTNIERRNLAYNRQKESNEALVTVAAFHLPVRIRAQFTGDVGREVFIHCAVYEDQVLPREAIAVLSRVGARIEATMSRNEWHGEKEERTDARRAASPSTRKALQSISRASLGGQGDPW